LAPQKFLATGDLGVDMFFALSGFLIAFILIKECQKYESPIDALNFYRGRFLRIWPAMMVLSLLLWAARASIPDDSEMAEYKPTIGQIVYPLVFLSNITGQLQI